MSDASTRSGTLWVIGLGPGESHLLTPQAREALDAAERLYGYGPYLNRVVDEHDPRRMASDNREEGARARQALTDAAAGARVAMVSGGDPGVFAMAAAVCEQIERGPAHWRTLEVQMIPGISAMFAVAAACGAPLGHDFCAVSLSDNLKPWALIERRLKAAAGAGFVMALYNPISASRPWQLGRAFELLRDTLAGETVVIFGRAAGRADEHMQITTLAEARAEWADMATLVMIGSEQTRVVERPDQPPLVYSPRFAPGCDPESPA
ncbi:precorrin-3B C(17)-methyltransferase [Kushneria phosphatilytica]|uniref:Precorrin-3B C(17)-methyltransferase n=1 Tax=Kushneria phosphatilytica TaxID=657387 RepID=A0A1S1NUK8_9GAMM|nr:precorrin-3B C(17)-methyltransferase [Kushneria phosphatilytica]OHV08439.1 precorrin-3B C(17)-methyltransferase [Kushneria phosphatilytica]QEL09867.1 precorrin-3B C(17)-methyltransferase [Kushneria phosphatilytica]